MRVSGRASSCSVCPASLAALAAASGDHERSPGWSGGFVSGSSPAALLLAANAGAFASLGGQYAGGRALALRQRR